MIDQNIECDEKGLSPVDLLQEKYLGNAEIIATVGYGVSFLLEVAAEASAGMISFPAVGHFLRENKELLTAGALGIFGVTTLASGYNLIKAHHIKPLTA